MLNYCFSRLQAVAAWFLQFCWLATYMDIVCQKWVSSSENSVSYPEVLFVPQSRLDVRKYFFCHRVVRCWNSLPAQPDDFSSLNNLKRLLERTDLSSFILFRDWLCFSYFLCILVSTYVFNVFLFYFSIFPFGWCL